MTFGFTTRMTSPLSLQLQLTRALRCRAVARFPPSAQSRECRRALERSPAKSAFRSRAAGRAAARGLYSDSWRATLAPRKRLASVNGSLRDHGHEEVSCASEPRVLTVVPLLAAMVACGLASLGPTGSVQASSWDRGCGLGSSPDLRSRQWRPESAWWLLRPGGIRRQDADGRSCQSAGHCGCAQRRCVRR